MDVQDSAVEVVEAQGDELASAGTGVGGEADQEEVLLGQVPAART